MLIEIEVPQDKIPLLRDYFFRARPIPQIPDPLWIDPKDGTLQPMVNEFSDLTWFKKCIRKYVLMECHRGWERKQLDEGGTMEEIVSEVE